MQVDLAALAVVGVVVLLGVDEDTLALLLS
jgi:hypothetical protein